MRTFVACVVAPLCVLTAACGGAIDSSDGEEGVGATQYVDVLDFAKTNVDEWIGVRNKLAQEFIDVCGDTFCEGDYANLTPLTFTCSVSSKIGNVHECAWTFAGSLEALDPNTSVISVDAPTYQCKVHPKTTVTKLSTLFTNSSNALKEILPGTTGSIYDELVDCFQHPIGNTPVTFVSSAAPTYVEATDYYVSAKYKAQWQAAKAAAKRGFDNVCGDTFCGSDYGDLQSLDLVCSVTHSTGAVKDCAWVFGGSFATVASTGTLQETSKSFACHVPMHGTLSQLIGVLTATGTDNPIQRPLPNATTSLYDGLGGCLP